MWYAGFSIVIILFLLWCILKSGKRADNTIEKFDRERIVAHRDKQTLIVPPGTESKDETQVLYFATGKGFVNAEQIQ